MNFLYHTTIGVIIFRKNFPHFPPNNNNFITLLIGLFDKIIIMPTQLKIDSSQRVGQYQVSCIKKGQAPVTLFIRLLYPRWLNSLHTQQHIVHSLYVGLVKQQHVPYASSSTIFRKFAQRLSRRIIKFTQLSTKRLLRVSFANERVES